MGVARVARVARVGGEEKKHEEAWMAAPESGARVIYQIYQQRLYIELWKENEIEGNIRSRSTLEMSFVPRLLSARLACVGDQDKNCLRGNPYIVKGWQYFLSPFDCKQQKGYFSGPMY